MNNTNPNILPLRHSICSLLFIVGLLLAACSGEDRSGEQPELPTVRTCDVIESDSGQVFTGMVLSSPNSSLKSCGFYYGNDTLEVTLTCEEAADTFSLTVDSLLSGTYYVEAWARNGMGTSVGDAVIFSVP